MSRLVRMLIGSAVGVAMIVVGVVIGRAIAGPDEADIQPMAERVVLAPVADELEPVALESEPVALEELADADGETLSAAEILPTPDRLIPVLEPAFVGGGDGDIDAIAEMLLERPIVSQTPSSDAADAGVGVGQVASLPAFAGAIPAFAPIPDLEADIDSTGDAP